MQRAILRLLVNLNTHLVIGGQFGSKTKCWKEFITEGETQNIYCYGRISLRPPSIL